MPPQEQAELWMALRDRMKANWSELTLQEKKAGMALCGSLKISINIFKAQIALEQRLRVMQIRIG